MPAYASQVENAEAIFSRPRKPVNAAHPSKAARDASISGLYPFDFAQVPLRAPYQSIGRDKDPDAGTGSGSGSASPPARPAKPDAGGGSGSGSAAPPARPAKKAGVDSFSVTWKKDAAQSSATSERLRIDFRATFKNDATHDPGLCEFRQNAFHHLEITDGPHKGLKEDNGPIHDDHYSRADDVNSNPATGTLFEGYDNPGVTPGSLDKDDVIDYSFTAEQMIIDTSDNNKVLQTKGPHTATIKGKHPRAHDGVPASL
jgi:hypothetical protein